MNTPPKPTLTYQIVKQPEQVVYQQQINTIITIPAPVVGPHYINFTPEKPSQNARKINFIYNNKAPAKFENLGVNDLESFKDDIHFVKPQVSVSKPNNIPAPNAKSTYHSQLRDPYKSTQGTMMASDKVGSWDESPGLSREFRLDSVNPITLSDKL